MKAAAISFLLLAAPALSAEPNTCADRGQIAEGIITLRQSIPMSQLIAFIKLGDVDPQLMMELVTKAYEQPPAPVDQLDLIVREFRNAAELACYTAQ